MLQTILKIIHNFNKLKHFPKVFYQPLTYSQFLVFKPQTFNYGQTLDFKESQLLPKIPKCSIS